MALFAEVCGADRDRLGQALAGVRAYQAHPHRRAAAPAPAIAAASSVTLRDYGGAGPVVVVVPSLINPPTVLDLAPGNSLLRWLAANGVRPLLVDWGTPGAAELGFDLAAMVTERLVPLLRGLGAPVALAGYCMGGTMALAAAAQLPVRRLALLATPWRFDGYGAEQRTAIADYAASVLPIAAGLGALPMDLLQPAFWRLAPEATVAKFERLAGLDAPAQEAFVALEDWASDGPPLSLPVARALFDDLFRDNRSGRGDWQVGGRAVNPETFRMPILDVVATRDRLVPAASAAGVGERLDVDGGHVGMIVGSRGRERLWEPLARFLRED